jgi:hypothetical protein
LSASCQPGAVSRKRVAVRRLDPHDARAEAQQLALAYAPAGTRVRSTTSSP